MADLFDGYPAAAPLGVPAWDEMFDGSGTARPGYHGLHAVVGGLGPADLEARAVARDRNFRDQGITFQLSGEERPFPLDLMPRVISAEEWARIEAGVVQRVRALEAFLADIYGPAHCVRDGVIPRRLLTSSQHFHRQAFGLQPTNGVRVHVAGIDLVRDEQGDFRVLEDNLRTPSGVSYVVENRRALTRVFPELFGAQRVLPVADYPSQLREALRAAAPGRAQGREPVVVLLTPGVYNSAYFEHTFLARQMGIELVEGRDLLCRDNVVYMRTTEGEQRVDVVYRRIDDDFLDPVQFRGDSLVGCPGIVNAARAGNVTLANAVGNGVADDKLAYTYVGDLIRYYFAEEPILPNVETLRLEDPHQRVEALDRLHELVLKPVDASGGYGIVIGPQASTAELDAARQSVRANPRAWIAQRPVTLSTAPTYVDGQIRPRHVDLRPFAVNHGDRVWVVPGGLTRVALRQGSLIVNSSQGGGSKDTWVLAEAVGTFLAPVVPPAAVPVAAARPPLAAPPEGGPAVGPAPENYVQQAQQSQQGPRC